MKIVVFGATGSIGQEVVKQALEQGLNVTAITRSASKIQVQHPLLLVKEGDVLDCDFVDSAIQGHEAVICAIGAGKAVFPKQQIRASVTKHILKAMEKYNIQRFICQTTLGVGDSEASLNFYWRHIMFGMLLREVFADHVLQEEYIKQSQVAWTIVRPSAFTDESKGGQYLHGFDSGRKGLELKIARTDVADFMLSQLHTNEYLYKTPGISY